MKKYVGIILLAVGALFLFLNRELLNLDQIQPEWAGLTLLALYIVKSFVFVIPVMPLYVTAGLMFDFPLALLVTAFGLFLNMSIGYYLGRRYGTARIMPLLEKNKKIKALFANERYTGMSLCFLMRFLAVPLDWVHLFFGANRLKYTHFLLASFLGLAPRFIPFILLGESVSSSFSLEFLVPFGISTIISLLLFVLIQRLESKKD